MTLHRALIRTLQLAIFAVLIVVIAIYLRDQFVQLAEADISVNWGVLILAQLGMTIGLAILPLGSFLTLRALHEPLPAIIVWRVFFISNVAKYLPGSVWALPGRAFLYQRNGITTMHSVMAVFWEVLLMVAGAGVTALLSLRLVSYYVSSTAIYAGLFVGAVLFAIIVWGIGSGRIVNWLKARQLPVMVQRLIDQRVVWLTLGDYARVIATYILAWCMIGLSFAGMVYAIHPHLNTRDVIEIIGLYAGTWMIGFLVIITPGGIGVRDGLIILGLSVFILEPIPALAAIIARIGWTLAEIFGVAISTLIFYISRKSLTDSEAQFQSGDNDEKIVQNTP